jgi:phospholipid/cholesterol/gamma-HCH transport system substrate-binding protein
MENRAHALATGIFILAAIAATAAVFWWMSGQREITAQYLLVSSKSLTGLNPQATVRFRGVRAGRVEEISIDPDDRRKILVRISIAEGFPIMKSTSAKLNYQGVTGIAYVQLDDDGSSDGPLLSSGAKLARIPLQPSDFESFSSAAQEVLTQANALVGRLNVLLGEDNLKHVGNALASLDGAAARLDGTMKAMPEVISALKQTLSASNIKNLQTTLANLERASSDAAPALADLRKLMASLQSLGKRVDGLSTDAADGLVGNTLPRLNALIDDLSGTSRQLSRTLAEIERSPQSLVFGLPPPSPGPGEPGFKPPR